MDDEVVGTHEWRQICQQLILLLGQRDRETLSAVRSLPLDQIRYRAGCADGIRLALKQIGFNSETGHGEG